MNNDPPKNMLKNSWEKTTLLLIFIGVVLVFIWLGVLAVPRDNKDNNTDVSNGLSAQDVIADMAGKMQGKPLKIADRSAKNGLTSTGNVAYSASYYGEGKFQTQPDELFGIAVEGNLDSTNIDYESVVAYMIENGFDERESYIGQDGESFIRQVSYVSPDAVCHLNQISLLDTDINNLAVGVGCADVSSYKSVASRLKPFYEAFAQANPDHSDDLYMDMPNINKGKDGYTNAIVLINDYAGLFYRAPSSDWKYFMSVEQMPFCTFYDTADLKKSFSGQPCYDLDKQKQVIL